MTGRAGILWLLALFLPDLVILPGSARGSVIRRFGFLLRSGPRALIRQELMEMVTRLEIPVDILNGLCRGDESTFLSALDRLEKGTRESQFSPRSVPDFAGLFLLAESELDMAQRGDFHKIYELSAFVGKARARPELAAPVARVLLEVIDIGMQIRFLRRRTWLAMLQGGSLGGIVGMGYALYSGNSLEAPTLLGSFLGFMGGMAWASPHAVNLLSAVTIGVAVLVGLGVILGWLAFQGFLGAFALMGLGAGLYQLQSSRVFHNERYHYFYLTLFEKNRSVIFAFLTEEN
jgi:hypothetical protein